MWATVRVPGSKSLTNRALVLAALANGDSTVTGALRSRDTDLMIAALRALGAPLIVRGTDVTARRHTELRGGITVDCGLAGTVMRFVPPLAALASGTVYFDGDLRARERPLTTILDALRGLGVAVTGDALPFTLDGAGSVPGGEVTIDASASSQFVSGLLLSAARYTRGVTLHHSGKSVPSMPHIDMTVHMLRAAGIAVDDSEPNTWRVEPGEIVARHWEIEPDLSNATPFLAAAAVTAGRVTVPAWPVKTTQAGDGIREILARMGCRITLTSGDKDTGELTVEGPDRLSGVDVDLHDAGELTPTVAALAVLAEGPSHLHGIGHLRGHETDRLAALATEIAALGGGVTENDDGLTIHPKPLHGGVWHSYADHRMATAGAIIGLRVAGVMVEDIETTAKTLPGFSAMWTAMLRGAAE